MTISLTLRSVKGSNLTPAEVDANMVAIEDAVNDFTAPDGVGITTITVAGNQMTVHLSDGSTAGPFALPTAAFRWTGELVADHDYEELDVFQVPGLGVYLVLRPYHSEIADTGDEVPFDPAVTDTSGPLLELMFGTPQNTPLQISVHTETDYTLDSDGLGLYHRFTSPDPITVTVPLDIDHIAVVTMFRQVDDGQITFVGEATTDGTVTILTPESLKTRKSGSTATLVWVEDTSYDLAGDLELV